MMKFALTLLLSLPLQSSSFSPAARLTPATNGAPSSLIRPTVTSVSCPSSSWSTTTLMAKKRRRRKDTSPDPTTAQSGDLPDFYDEEGESLEEASAAEEEPRQSPMMAASTSPMMTSSTVTPVKRGDGLSATLAEEVGGNVDGLAEDTILEAMRGKAGTNWEPPRTIQDTLSDRSLEKFMDFDKMIEKDGGGGGSVMELPDFDEVISRRKRGEAATAMKEGRVEDAAMIIDTSGMGKKAARNMERKAAALQREIEEEEAKSPFEDFGKDLNILKLLENGAWLGIGLLVLWEVYINSPLFDRAAPLIPPVYDTPPGL